MSPAGHPVFQAPSPPEMSVVSAIAHTSRQATASTVLASGKSPLQTWRSGTFAGFVHPDAALPAPTSSIVTATALCLADPDSGMDRYPQAEAFSLEALFHGRVTYAIEYYQREYAWALTRWPPYSPTSSASSSGRTALAVIASWKRCRRCSASRRRAFAALSRSTPQPPIASRAAPQRSGPGSRGGTGARSTGSAHRRSRPRGG